jgi:hypothetical protein
MLLMASPGYEIACKQVAGVGWATKEKCRRPVIAFPIEVVSLLRRCFDAVPRLNNYEVQVRLRAKFKLGANVLRISQISGLVSSELKRRKEAAAAAVADAANQVEQAVSSADELTCIQVTELSNAVAAKAFAEHLASLRGQDFINGVLPAWKRNWRQSKSEVSNCERERSMMLFEEQSQLVIKKRGRAEHQPLPKAAAKAKKQALSTANSKPNRAVAKAKKQTMSTGTNSLDKRGPSTANSPNSKRRKAAPTKPTVLLKPKTRKCWSCGTEGIPLEDYDEKAERCADKAACEERKSQIGKRQRTSNNKYR